MEPQSAKQASQPTEFEDIRKQQLEGDFSGEYGKRIYCRKHYNSMTPLRILFRLGGRFPFTCVVEDDGSYLYDFEWKSFGAIYFLCVYILMLSILGVGVWNIAHISLEYIVTEAHMSENYTEQRNYENVLLKRYSIPLIFVFSSLVHGCIATAFIIRKRKYIAHYLTFWSKAVYTMHMDVSKGALEYSVRVVVLFVMVSTGLGLLSVYKIGPSAVGLPTVFGDLLFRLFLDHDGWLNSETDERNFVQIAGGIILIYAFIASKSSILLFVYHCKCIQSGFGYWNGRVYAAVLRGGEYCQTEEGRTTFKLLFKDHCILMDLMEGMDQVFAFTLESYFGLQVFSTFFELYFCIRTAQHGDSRSSAAYPEDGVDAFFVRPRDWAPGIIMLFVSCALMFHAAKSAAAVAEEAMAGLEVLRRKTMLGRKTDDELYFMLSMFSSYTAYKTMELSGGGYYCMNKDFIIGLVSNILSYFIILYQFQPVMDVSFPADQNRTEREKYGQFLADIEGLEENHYETTQASIDLFIAFRPHKT